MKRNEKTLLGISANHQNRNNECMCVDVKGTEEQLRLLRLRKVF